VKGKLVVELMVLTAVEAAIELEIVLPVVVIVEVTNELAVTTEDKPDIGAEVELETEFVKGTDELRLLDSWYKLSPFGPPQISILFAVHAILPAMASRVSNKAENQHGVCRSLTSSVSRCHATAA
jgi:hypothetical protein